jgi:O-antigen ligase
MTTHTPALPQPALSNSGRGLVIAALPMLAAFGYVAAADPRVPAAIGAIVVLLGWCAVAYQRPRIALSAAFFILLLAGTKFRLRESTDSLEGAVDAQVLMELGLFAAIAAATFAIWLAGHVARRHLTLAETIILGYAAFAVLSTAWSLAPMLTLVRSAQLGVVALLAMITARVFTPSEGLRRVFTAVAAFVLVFSALAIVFPFAAGTFVDGEHEGFRFAWFAAHPIEVGTLAAIGALGLIATMLFREGVQLRPMFGTFIVAILLVAVLGSTAARGPILAFAIALFVLFLMKVDVRLRAALMLAGTAVFAALFVAGPDVQAWLDSASSGNGRLTYTFFRGQSAQDVLELNGRIQLWSDLRPAITNHFFLGHGYLASRAVILDAANWAAAAHNALLQSVLDLGLIGSIGLIALLGGGLLGAVRARTQWRRAALGALVVFLIVNSVSTESFAGAPGFEMFLVFLCAILAGWDAAGTPAETDAA